MKNIGIYIHIPFCRAKCPYCDFYSIAAGEDEYDRYVDAIINRLAEYREALSEYSADSVYFGGGTPSLLGGERISELLQAVGRCLPLTHDCEITMEANPCSVDESELRTLRECGVNRLSIGVQSFVPGELKYLGRAHTADEAEAAFKSAKAAGFDNISIDLMLAIPEQTLSSTRQSLSVVEKLSPQHISAYMLKIEPNTAFSGRKSVDDDFAAQQYLMVCEALEGMGLAQYEISNFAEPGYPCRHNLKYWHCEEYLGLGPGAHSFLDGRRFYCPRSLANFYEGAPPVEDGVGGTAEEWIMLGLRLNEGISEREFTSRFNLTFDEFFRGREQKLIKAGFIRSTNEGIALTRQGFLLSNSVISELLW